MMLKMVTKILKKSGEDSEEDGGEDEDMDTELEGEEPSTKRHNSRALDLLLNSGCYPVTLM